MVILGFSSIRKVFEVMQVKLDIHLYLVFVEVHCCSVKKVVIDVMAVMLSQFYAEFFGFLVYNYQEFLLCICQRRLCLILTNHTVTSFVQVRWSVSSYVF